MEETGLFVSIVDEFPDVTHEYDYGVVAIRFFRCRVQGNPDLVSADDGFRWVKKSSLGDYEFPAANAEVVQALSACKRI